MSLAPALRGSGLAVGLMIALSTLLGVSGLAGLASALPSGDFGCCPQLLDGNQTILAMLATLSFLRLVARSGAHADERLPRGPSAILTISPGLELQPEAGRGLA